MEIKGFAKYTDYRFEISGETFAIINSGINGDVEWIEVEETRKNGQEDAHFCVIFKKDGDKWKTDDSKFWFDLKAEISKYLEQNPFPIENGN